MEACKTRGCLEPGMGGRGRTDVCFGNGPHLASPPDACSDEIEEQSQSDAWRGRGAPASPRARGGTAVRAAEEEARKAGLGLDRLNKTHCFSSQEVLTPHAQRPHGRPVLELGGLGWRSGLLFQFRSHLRKGWGLDRSGRRGEEEDLKQLEQPTSSHFGACSGEGAGPSGQNGESGWCQNERR